MADVVRLPLSSEIQPRDAIELANDLGYLDWGGNEMRNILAPTLDLSAATKKYVDDSVGAVVVTAGLPLDALFTVVRAKKVQLNGEAVTPILFKADLAAFYQCAGKLSPFTGITAAQTIKVSVEGVEKTITFAATAATHVSGAAPSEDISLNIDTKFKIAVDADGIAGTYRTVTIGPTGLNTGAKIATELQAKIRALGGIYAAVTVVFTSVYTITASHLGTAGRCLIAAGDVDDISTELKIGALGVSTSGTGNVANLASITAAEIIAIGMGADIVITNTAGGLRFTSAIVGRGSKILSGAGSANAAIGMTGGVTSFGAQGMGYAKDMLNDAYLALATLNGEATIAGKGLSINNRTALGFEILCETTASVAYVDLVVLGKPAV